MGYWFSAVDPSEESEGPCLIIHSPAEGATAPAAGPRRGRRPGRLAQTVVLDAPKKQDGPLVLAVGPAGAEVFTSPAAWEALSEPVLLVVAQYFRFRAVEQALVRVEEEARRDHPHAVSAGLRTWRHQRRLVANTCEILDLASDWMHFSGLYTDPARYCTSDRAAEEYATLADALDFEGWCERIDDKLETVQATYEAIADKLFHYKLFAWGMALEAAIVVLISLGLLYH
jgi:hypothetical protein